MPNLLDLFSGLFNVARNPVYKSPRAPPTTLPDTRQAATGPRCKLPVNSPCLQAKTRWCTLGAGLQEAGKAGARCVRGCVKMIARDVDIPVGWQRQVYADGVSLGCLLPGNVVYILAALVSEGRMSSSFLQGTAFFALSIVIVMAVFGGFGVL